MCAQAQTITRIQIEGFRSIRSQVVELGRLNVLIGPNGAGKSNLLSFLRMVAMLRTKSLNLFMNLTGGAAALLYRDPKVTPVMRFALEATGDDGLGSEYAAQLAHAAGDALIFVDEAVRVRKTSAEPWTEVSLGKGHVDSKLEDTAAANQSSAGIVRGWVSRINFYHFHDTSRESPLRQHRQREEDDYLRSDGRNLAPYLYRLATSSNESDRAALERIQTFVTRIAPFVKTLDPTLVNPSLPATGGRPLHRRRAPIRWCETPSAHPMTRMDLPDTG